MSLTDITPLETELAFRQSQQQKQVPAHKKVSKPRLSRYKPYMQHKKCDHCGVICDSVKRRRLNTSYENDESNHMESCIRCFDVAYAYYNDLWNDFYSSRF